ncbi:MAG: hypothetical protein GX325_10055 [Peptococcaceae bacterium]|nr:hypothetical protein [Peptococcaceae bacterium]
MAKKNADPMNSADKVRYFSPRLRKKLEGVLKAPVTVVEAPSGYGKTTALRGYLKDNLPHGMSVHWWSAGDEAPEAAWIRLCGELACIDSRVGKELSSMGFPRVTTAWEIAEMVSGIHCIKPTVLVLDDFQCMQGELPRSVMSALLSYTGANLHLVIVTQTTRPYRRSYFEKKGVYYIRMDDLRWQVGDVFRYFQLCGISVSRSTAEQLYLYTEGWIAALYLIMLQMQRGEGYSPGLGIIRLMESIVWAGMDDENKNALLHLVLFPGVTIEQMCFLLQAEPLPEHVFDLLEETPFISYEAQQRRYVPHAILREMLLRRLGAADSQTKIDCYSRAGDWYARMGEIQQALACYFRVQDYAAVLSLPLTCMTMARIEGQPFTHLAAKLLADCPLEIKHRYPISLLRIAYAFIGANQTRQADALMEEIKTIIGEVQDGTERKALLGEWMLVAAFRELPDIVKMEPIIKQAVEFIGGRCRTITPDEPFAFGLPLMIFFSKRPGGMQAELRAMANVVQHLTTLTGVYSGADVLFKAEWAIYRGKLAEAEPLCHQAFYLADGTNQWSVRAGAVNQLAQIAFKRGSNKDLTYYIKALEESVGHDPLSPLVSQMLQADYYSWRGLFQLTVPWINAGKIPFPDAPVWVRAYLRYAHLAVLLQKEEYSRFLGVAEVALAESQKSGYLVMKIYLYLLAAIGYLKMGRRDQAFDYVQKALADARPDQIFLPIMELKGNLDDLVEKAFYTRGEEMPEEVVTEGQVIDDNWKVLIRYASESNNSPYNLTERETEVATLAAKGLSNKEIGLQLFISESTVKYHLRTVFSKLGIDRRSKLPGLLAD